MALDPEVAAYRKQLFRDYGENPTPELRNAIAESHMPLASYFAGKYANRGVPQDDLDQVANLALLKALDRFDPDRGIQFSTFAGRTINGELKKYFRDKTWSVRVPRQLKERALLVRQIADDLTKTLGKSPTPQQVADEAGLELEDVLEALDVRQKTQPVSIDQPKHSGDGDDAVAPADIGQEDDGFALTETQLTVKRLLSTVSEQERELLRLRFDEEKSQAEIAEIIGVSQMQVSRLLRGALSRLRAVRDESDI